MNNKFILCAAVTLLIFACSTDAIIDEQDLTESHQNNQEAITTDNTASATTTAASSTSTINLDVKTDAFLKTDLDQSGNYTSSLNGAGLSNCSDFVATEANRLDRGQILRITYNTSLSLDEISCVRKEYFQNFPLLRLFPLNYPSKTVYNEFWLVLDFIGPTQGSASQKVRMAIVEDERVE